MLDIRTVGQLAEILRVTSSELEGIAGNAEAYYEELVLIDPAKPGKIREVVNVTGPLRTLQSNLLCNLLRPRLKPSTYSHGGVVGRSIRTNAEPHRDSVFYFSTDIADFYPTISHRRIYKLFSGEFGCSRPVSRVCTKLCTRRGHLAQGLIASPILADRLMAGPDRRIGAMCDKLSRESGSAVPYTRFVDDLTITAKFPIESGSTPRIVVEILKEYGFRINPAKQAFGRLAEGGRITKLRIHRGKLDISPEYLAGVYQQLADAAALGSGEKEGGVYYTAAQIFGRIQFIGWVNHGHLGPLMAKYNSIDWLSVEAEAAARGLVASRKTLTRKITRHQDSVRLGNFSGGDPPHVHVKVN